MGSKAFTSEELAVLRKNPYVKGASTHRIQFTITFKEEFWSRYENGEAPYEIIRSMGIEPDILGEARVRGIVTHTRAQAVSGAGFTEGYHRHDEDALDKQPPPVSKRVLRLEHELAYMKQEMEFIKKIILADREAERKCLSKQGRRSNSDSSAK